MCPPNIRPQVGRSRIAKSRSPEEAKASGEWLFFTGLRCSRGHLANRYAMTGGCVLCPLHEPQRGQQKRSDVTVSDLMERKRAYWTGMRRLQRSVRTRIWAALSGNVGGNGATVESILGCTWSEFRVHIERQFLPGMTWDSRDAWHVDHIVPISSATNEAEVIALNHFTNLRPLWAVDNLKKSDKRTHLL